MSTAGSRGFTLSVALPASIVSDTPHLREKTAKLGLVARACTIFGVSQIILYPDDARRNLTSDLELSAELLRYLDTPPYLRKKLYGLSPSFQFAGILPPLQSPPHNVPGSATECKLGDMRVGIVISRRSDSVTVDAGLERSIVCPSDLPVGERLTLRLTGLGKTLTGEIVDESKIHIYWGYRVKRTKSKLSSLLEKERYELRIGTSRYGTEVQNVWSEMSKSLRSVKSVLIAFGSPKMGLKEILQREGVGSDAVFDFLVNTVPEQNVATVRTEEAVLVTLGLLNVMRFG